MRLVTFIPPDGVARAGALLGPTVIDLASAAPLALEEAGDLRWDMLSLLRGDPDQAEVNLEMAADLVAAVAQVAGIDYQAATDPLLEDQLIADGMFVDLSGGISIGGEAMVLPLDQVRILAPLPRPSSIRDFYAFEEHVANARRQRGLEVPAEWYRFPAFYFSNHQAVYGPGDEIAMPRTDALDYELELAIVIGKAGRDIDPEDAIEHIAGFTIMNDWSARDIQADERPVGLGPAKAKDFATSLGPWLVTPDELEIYADEGRLNLTMQARVNGFERSRGNSARMYFTIGDLIAHASRDTMLYPGDVLGSGTVGGGCLLELTAGYGPWLERGDIVELEITGLGILRNRVI
ncbi:MAG: fumarylacetoacetate hydrolase family protein [Oscillochloris sp.]|nr:fumarylacetoacetate hydrolase family protein [Oscillochloris sp.]